MHNYSKICRICMSPGSRDIFHRSNIDPNSPLERLLEKMRYVTMMKIEENDDLPRLICDLCLVQLNVAYNIKRQAVENDTKLRQYFIEHGITAQHSTPNRETNNNLNISDRSDGNINLTTNIETSIIKRGCSNNKVSPTTRKITDYPIVPMIIKTEPESHILLDDSSESILENSVSLNHNETLTKSSNSIQSNDNFSQINKSPSMVYLNGYNINTLTPYSEVEYYHNTNADHATTNTQTLANSVSSANNTTQIISSENKITEVPKTNKTNLIKGNLNLSQKNTTRTFLKVKQNIQLKTRRILPEERVNNTLSTLKIDMAPPSGKISREELKKNLFFGNKKKQKQICEKSKSVPIVNKRKIDAKLTNMKPIIVLNPYKIKEEFGNENIEIKSISSELQSIPIKIKSEPDKTNLNLIENIATTSNSTKCNKKKIDFYNLPSSMVYLNDCSFNTSTTSTEMESLISINTNKNTNIDKKSNKKLCDKTKKSSKQKTLSLTKAEMTRKRIAKKRLGGSIKTGRITSRHRDKTYLQSTLSTLKIDMAPPCGKMSREELKNKLYFGNGRTRYRRLEEVDSITKNTKMNQNEKKIKTISKVLLNPFNKENNETNQVRSQKLRRKRSKNTNIKKSRLKLLPPKIEI